MFEQKYIFLVFVPDVQLLAKVKSQMAIHYQANAHAYWNIYVLFAVLWKSAVISYLVLDSPMF